MEIRIGNSIRIGEIEQLRIIMNNFFKTDFQVIFKGDYVYLRETT